MKNIILCLIAVLTLSTFSNCSDDKFDIVGKWQVNDEGEKGYFSFEADGYAYFEIGGEIMGGKEFMIEGVKSSFSYTIDYTKKPIALDVVLTHLDSGETNNSYGIVEIIDDDQIKIQMGLNADRPKAFDKEETKLFKRVK